MEQTWPSYSIPGPLPKGLHILLQRDMHTLLHYPQHQGDGTSLPLPQQKNRKWQYGTYTLYTIIQLQRIGNHDIFGKVDGSGKHNIK